MSEAVARRGPMFCRLWAEAGSGGSGRPCPRLSSPAPTRVCPCRVVPVGFWPPSRAVSYRNSCSKAIAEQSALGKFALIPAVSLPTASPKCPEKTSEEACVSLLLPVFWKGKWRLASGARADPRNDLRTCVGAERGSKSSATRGAAAGTASDLRPPPPRESSSAAARRLSTLTSPC